MKIPSEKPALKHFKLALKSEQYLEATQVKTYAKKTYAKKTRRHFLQNEQQAATWRFADFIVQKNKRFLSFLVQQQIAESAAKFFLHTFSLENKAQTSEKKYRAVTFY